jgi:hypothetical protein
MTREEKIQQLIEYDIKYRMNEQEVRSILYHGHVGLRHYTDRELNELYQAVIGNKGKQEKV